LSFLATCAIASADTLFLRNGTVIEGEVVRDTVDGVVFNGKIAGIWGEQFFERARVDRVERVPGDQGPGSARAAPPSLPASKPTPVTPVPSNPVPASTPAAPDRPTQSGTPNQTPSNGVVEVEVTGQGATPQEAFDDAVREALRQVVGTFVRADSKVEDDRLVQDRIISHSQGFIEKATKVGNAKLKDGIYQQGAIVLVRRGEVGAVFAEGAKSEAKVDADSISARMNALRMRDASANELLAALFEGWPANVMKATVAEGPKALPGFQIPRGINAAIPDGHSYVEVKVDFEIDPNRWAEWCKAAKQVFEQVALKKENLKWNAKTLCKPIQQKLGQGESFTALFAGYMSSKTAGAIHLDARGAFREPFKALFALKKQKNLDGGSLKAGLVTEVQGTSVALYERFGSSAVDLYLLPVASGGQGKELRELDLHGIEYPTFAALPRVECDILLKDGTSAGSLVQEPCKQKLAAVGTYSGAWIGGQGDFSVLLAPILTSSGIVTSSGGEAILLLPAFVASEHNGGSETVLSLRQTLVFGFLVPNDDLVNLDKVVVELSSNR